MDTTARLGKAKTDEDISLVSVPLEDVLDAERSQIEAIRKIRKTHDDKFSWGAARPATKAPEAPGLGTQPATTDEPERRKPNDKWRDVIDKAHEANFVGLAFSGGGIRSATFNLGVLQALADLRLLYRIDYLSTVSGGGYIGGWLAAWTKWLKSFAKVQERLSADRVHQRDNKEPTEVRFLRVFSNYLTPKLGFFSGDTWTMVAIYLRNMLLNQIVVLATLVALLLAPHTLEQLARAFRRASGNGHVFVWGAVAILMFLAFVVILINMEYLDSQQDKQAPKLTRQVWILLTVGLPLFIGAILAALSLAGFNEPVAFREGGNHDTVLQWEGAGLGALAYGAVWLVATVVAKAARKIAPEMRPFLYMLIAAIGAGAVGGWLYVLLSGLALWAKPENELTAGLPLVLGVFLLTGTLHLGFTGTIFHDSKREWWGRLGAWLLLWGLLWTVLFWVAFAFPAFIEQSLFRTTWKSIAGKYLTPAWIFSTAMSLLAGKSSASGKPEVQTWQDAVAKVGPYIFVAGLLCWMSWIISKVQPELWSARKLLEAIGVCVGVAAFMAWRVDINQFSMHLFYRNRLVRCYLGASNEKRAPNRFTGFDSNDDVALKDLSADAGYDGPYPILNASLNLVKGKDLAWQERKAESFVMTPKYCGYDVWLEEQDSPMMSAETDQELKKGQHEGAQKKPLGWVKGKLRERWGKLERFGYRNTELYAFPTSHRPWVGPNLGLAMAISGAAASPNMGFHSSPAVGFLMTVFNVRLGQWLGNPRHSKTSGRPTPLFGLPYLVNELLGGTDDTARYVYLSDGGHFENLAVYELVKRRCGLIIVCDAEEDKDYKFEGLGNAIRKCRTDMGIDIELDVSEIAPKKADRTSRMHCSIGTIHYEQADAQAPPGRIIYFKASLTGDEPADVKNYKKAHSSFPHESTADQWFSESQFESYRQLGYHEVWTSFQALPPTGQQSARTRWWSATGAAIREAFRSSAGSPPQREDAASKTQPLNEKLRGILNTYGFEISKLNKGLDSVSGAVPD